MDFLQEQLSTFSVAISFGIFIGIMLDFYKNFFKLKKMNKYVTAIFDFIFWFFITFIFAFVMLSSNWGEIRGYIFLGVGIGATIYYIFFAYFFKEGFTKLRKIILLFYEKIVLAIKKIVKKQF